MTFAMEFMTFWTYTYAYGLCMDYIWTIMSHLDLFETIYGHTFTMEYLCYVHGLWTLALNTLLITLIS